MSIKHYLPRHDPDSLLAYISLGIIATTGVYYVSILPALVGGLVDGLGFTDQQAGYTVSANVYGATLGAFLAVFTVKTFPWKLIVSTALVALLSLDLLSAWVLEFEMLAPLRFISGACGGLVTGGIFGVIARVGHPTRAYGIMLTCNVAFGSLGLYLLPSLVLLMGAKGLFFTLAALAVVALLCVQLMSDYLIKECDEVKELDNHCYSVNMRLPVILTLGSIFIFQASNMELFAYLQRVGLFHDLSMDWISFSLSAGSLFGILGTILAVVIGTRFGLLKPIVVSYFLSMLAVFLFLHAMDQQVYLVANLMFQVPWGFALTYLFGMCAELDQSGQLASLGSLMSKFGMASGPFIAAKFMNGLDYNILIYFCMVGIMLTFLCSLYPANLVDSISRKNQNSNG